MSLAVMVPLGTLLSLVTTAGLVALVLLQARVRSGPSAGRLMAEVLLTTLGLAALVFGLVAAAQRVPW